MYDETFKITSFRQTTYENQFIFAGKGFQWKNFKIAPNGITNYQIKCGASQVTHLTKFVLNTSSTSLSVMISEKGIKADGTISTTGIGNLDQRRSSTNTTQIRVNPTTSTGGATAPITLIDSKLFKNSTFSIFLMPELILKKGTDYLFSINNSNVNGKKLDMDLIWYESNN